MNKLRRLAISIIEDVEEHVNTCEKEEKNPFNEEEWYSIEDKVYDLIYEAIVGKEE